MRKLFVMLTAAAAIVVFVPPASAQVVGSGSPSDADLQTQRNVERGVSPALPGSGIFDIAIPSAGTLLQPVQRVPRDKFGVVGPFPLTLEDLDALVFPGSTASEKNALLEGLTFFTAAHPAAEGAGAMANQPFCLGCHQNAADGIRSPGLLSPTSCIPGSTCVSVATRAGRSTPTNFAVTSLDPATGGGLAADNVDAIFNTGKTAAFTTFGDFTLSLTDTAAGSIGCFDPLDGPNGAIHNCKRQDGTTLSFTSQPFSGFVQHVRPSVAACFPKPIPPLVFDTNLTGGNPNGFRRAVGERAGPPYVGRGLMEAVPNDDILANTDPVHANGTSSSLGNFFRNDPGCTTGCISGKANMIPPTGAFVPAAGQTPARPPGLGRFGLRANGVEILQFVVGGAQGEIGITSALNRNEIPLPKLFPGGTTETDEPDACKIGPEGGHRADVANNTPPVTSDEAFLSAIFSTRSLIRNIATPEFGDALLHVLQSSNPAKPQFPFLAEPQFPFLAKPQFPFSVEAKVQRGAELFGIDLVAFANRTVRSGMTAGGDGRDVNAINQTDRKLNCVGCHTPIQRTGQSPADLGAGHLSNVWAPIFSDLLLHKMPVVDAERSSPMPRDVVVIRRLFAQVENPAARLLSELNVNPGDGFSLGNRRVFQTLDIPRNLADDTFNSQKGAADGREFRTAPLMALGRIGPPFLHDARAYLSQLSVDSTPAGTVTTNNRVTNAPLVVRTVNDALLAAIELHDLPAPDDENTSSVPGAGCPVPPEPTNVSYGLSLQDAKNVICPPYNSAISQANRSDAREVIYRFRQLSAADQQAVIEFLKQL